MNQLRHIFCGSIKKRRSIFYPLALFGLQYTVSIFNANFGDVYIGCLSQKSNKQLETAALSACLAVILIIIYCFLTNALIRSLPWVVDFFFFWFPIMMCLICNAFDEVPTKFQLLISMPVRVLRVNFAVKCALTFRLWETIGISYFSSLKFYQLFSCASQQHFGICHSSLAPVDSNLCKR